jgi:glutathione S-transferase
MTYKLYGSHASYYTAKVRACLRKKGIPFVEGLPAHPLFRAEVRPVSGSHRIPQLLLPDGKVIQDSIEIIDHIERVSPDTPAFPDTPCQRVFVHLMELMGSEGLLPLAWLHRWTFEENRHFVLMEFGRSFRPQGSDEELLHYGKIIAERMMSYGLPESTPELRNRLDSQYMQLLGLFEQHLLCHPYLLGGLPSAADYALMGALHAHLGRDPAGLRLMQRHAPRTFRWVEHMLVPGIQSPEFAEYPMEYLAEDRVPETALAFLRYIAETWGGRFVRDVMAFEQAMSRLQPPVGHVVDSSRDQPELAEEKLMWRGKERVHAANVHNVWISQRARACFQALAVTEQTAIEAVVGEGMCTMLLRLPVVHPLRRVHNRLVIA